MKHSFYALATPNSLIRDQVERERERQTESKSPLFTTHPPSFLPAGKRALPKRNVTGVEKKFSTRWNAVGLARKSLIMKCYLPRSSTATSDEMLRFVSCSLYFIIRNHNVVDLYDELSINLTI